MEQYISKNSLTVEIEKLKKRFMTDQDDEFSDGYHYALKLLSSFLDNFEVKEINLEKSMKLWIKRTEADIPDDVYESVVERHPENRIFYTELYVFYDKPIGSARVMCKVPNYMFPEIKEEECVEFESTVKL